MPVLLEGHAQGWVRVSLLEDRQELEGVLDRAAAVVHEGPSPQGLPPGLQLIGVLNMGVAGTYKLPLKA